MASVYVEIVNALFKNGMVQTLGYVDGNALRVAFHREQKRMVEAMREMDVEWGKKTLSIKKVLVTLPSGEVVCRTDISLVDKNPEPCYTILPQGNNNSDNSE